MAAVIALLRETPNLGETQVELFGDNIGSDTEPQATDERAS